MQARRFLKAWWPEMLCAALLVLIAFAGQPDDFLFSIFCAIVGAVFWAMGYRHRVMPVHRQIREIWETTRRIEDNGLGMPGPRSTSGPLARIIPLRRK